MIRDFDGVNVLSRAYDIGYDDGVQKGKLDGFDYGVRKVAELLHEYDAIECLYCPAYKMCNDDCEIILMRYLKQEKEKNNEQ